MDCHGLNALAMTTHSELRRQVIARSKYQLGATMQSKIKIEGIKSIYGKLQHS